MSKKYVLFMCAIVLLVLVLVSAMSPSYGRPGGVLVSVDSLCRSRCVHKNGRFAWIVESGCSSGFSCVGMHRRCDKISHANSIDEGQHCVRAND